MRLRSATRSLRAIVRMSWPSTVTLPESGCSRPTMWRSVTDLPVPDGPMMTSVSPRWTSRSRPASTTFLPKALCTFSKRMTGASLISGLLVEGPGHEVVEDDHEDDRVAHGRARGVADAQRAAGRAAARAARDDRDHDAEHER